jgi:hypothetical protein
MAVIGITIDEVLRDFLGQFATMYDRYISEFYLEDSPVTNFNQLDEVFKFNSIDEMNYFLYVEHSLEVFGTAKPSYPDVIVDFNEFLTDIVDEGEHEIIILSKEVENSIQATLFFLSKLGCKATHIRFVKNYENMWDYADIIVTANPNTLLSKPSEKVSIKVDSTYNNNVGSDYKIKKLSDFTKSEKLQKEILNREYE